MNAFSRLMKDAEEGRIPPDSPLWATPDPSRDVLLAHYAAGAGWLPAGFKQWGLSNSRGWSVGHTLAARKKLPPAFDGWENEDDTGTSVKDIYDARK